MPCVQWFGVSACACVGQAVLQLPGEGVPDAEIQVQALGLLLNLVLDHAVNAQRVIPASLSAWIPAPR
jgi:hypothetical protein